MCEEIKEKEGEIKSKFAPFYQVIKITEKVKAQDQAKLITQNLTNRDIEKIK